MPAAAVRTPFESLFPTPAIRHRPCFHRHTKMDLALGHSARARLVADALPGREVRARDVLSDWQLSRVERVRLADGSSLILKRSRRPLIDEGRVLQGLRLHRHIRGPTMTATGTPTDNVYTRIGVKPFINANIPFSYLGGTLEWPEVRRAMDEASRHTVDIGDLQRAVGKRLAEISGAESGMVTSGAAGSIAAATAACIAGTDPEKIWQLPDTTGLKHEVVMMGGRSIFDSAMRLVGGTPVVVKSVEGLAAALNERTAMFLGGVPRRP